MKLKANREMVIGLSVLLVLAVILGGVVVWRIRRAPHEEIVAKEDQKHEEHADEHARRDAESPKPIVLTPVEAPNRDGLRPLGDPGQWRAPSQEKEIEKETQVQTAAAFIGNSRPEYPDKTDDNRQQGRDDARTTFSPMQPPPVPSDGSYAGMTAPPVIHPDGARSMVVQVSGSEATDAGPRPLDANDARRYENRDRREPGPAAADANGLAPASGMPPARYDGQANGMAVDPDAARRYADRVREQDMRAASPAADRTAANGYAPQAQPIGQPPPYGYADPSRGPAAGYSAAPSGYAPGGYAPDGGPRPGEFRDRVPGENPIRPDGKYEVQPNDSYWTISERVYGSGAYFRALAEANRGKAARPDRLSPGLLISTPPVAQLEKDYPDLCPRPDRRDTVRNRASGMLASTAGGGRTYVVQEGDTLSSIARNEMGKVSRWAEIYQLNREVLGKDYDYLTPGLRLVLPIRDSQPADRTARRDGSDPSGLR